jgi:hypothetical protein
MRLFDSFHESFVYPLLRFFLPSLLVNPFLTLGDLATAR